MSNFDEKLIQRLTKLEREVERLKVKESPIMSNFLLTTGKAADSDKLDNINSTGFVQTSGNQTVAGTKTFSSIPVLPSSNPTTSNQAVRKGYADATYLGKTAKAADADKLDGLDSTAFLQVPTFSTTAPTPTASSGTFTTVSCAVKAITIGKLRIISGLVYIGNAGTASGTLRVPYPSGAPASIGGGRWAGAGYSDANVNCIVSLLPSNAYLEILKYDGTTAIGTGASISFSISYELS